MEEASREVAHDGDGADRAREAERWRDRRPEAGFGLVEALIAFVLLAIGLLAVAGIALSVAAQTQDASYTTDQDQAAQQVLEVTETAGYSSVPVGTKDTTVSVGDFSYQVTRTVSQVNPRTKRVTVEVPGQGDDPDEQMVTHVYDRRTPPSS